MRFYQYNSGWHSILNWVMLNNTYSMISQQQKSHAFATHSIDCSQSKRAHNPPLRFHYNPYYIHGLTRFPIIYGWRRLGTRTDVRHYYTRIAMKTVAVVHDVRLRKLGDCALSCNGGQRTYRDERQPHLHKINDLRRVCFSCAGLQKEGVDIPQWCAMCGTMVWMDEIARLVAKTRSTVRDLVRMGIM